MTQEQANEKAREVWSNSDSDQASTCAEIAKALLDVEQETVEKTAERCAEIVENHPRVACHSSAYAIREEFKKK